MKKETWFKIRMGLMLVAFLAALVSPFLQPEGNTPLNRDEYLSTLIIGVPLAIFAVSWTIIMTLTLPKTDLAHGQMPFQDPLVLPIMSMVAVASAVLAWPFYATLGWRLPPARVGMAAGVATLAFIIVATPFNSGVGWLGSYVVVLISLTVCRFKMKQSGQQDKD